jgi:L-fuculose-phosphate aldolase
MIAVGSDLHKAMWLAIEVETLCKQYAAALQIGKPHVLADDEIMRTVEKFRDYGSQQEIGSAESPPGFMRFTS